MTNEVMIQSLRQVQQVVAAATACVGEIRVSDTQGAVADARSILGLMSLDYSQPVRVQGASAEEVQQVLHALA